MATPLRPRAVPHCSACMRTYAFGSRAEPAVAPFGSLQQIRGKKKMAKAPTSVPVKLLKDIKAYGRKGTIVPITAGRMRNEWFPRRIAEYVTMSEIRNLRLKNVQVARDLNFGFIDLAEEARLAQAAKEKIASFTAKVQPTIRKAPELERLSPERSTQLLQIFVPKRLDFYRQPIAEALKDKEAESEKKPEEPSRSASGAAADLLAARQQSTAKASQGIYGSVSIHDVLIAIRAAMATNDESGKVVLAEDDIKFTHTTSQDADDSGKLKHVGEFPVEIRVKGAEGVITRTVKIHAQDL